MRSSAAADRSGVGLDFDRDRRPAVLAARDHEPRCLISTHTALSQCRTTRCYFLVNLDKPPVFPGGDRRHPARRLGHAAADVHAARVARPRSACSSPRAPAAAVGDRPLSVGAGDDAARLLRVRAGRLDDARAGPAAPRLDGGRRRARRCTGWPVRRDAREHHRACHELAFREDFHTGLAASLESPAVRPTGSLPAAFAAEQQADAGRSLDSRPSASTDIVARSEAGRHRRAALALENRIRNGSVAVYPLGIAVFFEAIVDVGGQSARPGPACRLQAHLHEPLLRGVWQLLSDARRRSPRPGVGTVAARWLGVG